MSEQRGRGGRGRGDRGGRGGGDRGGRGGERGGRGGFRGRGGEGGGPPPPAPQADGGRGGGQPFRGGDRVGSGAPYPARGDGGGRGGFVGRGGGGGAGDPTSTAVNVQMNPARLDFGPGVVAMGMKRPGFGSRGQAIMVDTNCFDMTIPEDKIYQYDAFVPEIKVKARKMEIFQKLLELPEFIAVSPKRGAFDSGALYFSPQSIGTSHQFMVPTGGKSSITVRLKFTVALNPEILRQYTESRMSRVLDRQGVQGETTTDAVLAALNTALRMRLITMFPLHNRTSFYIRDANFKQFRNSRYADQEIWRGSYQSIRPAMGRVMLNLDISTGVVWKSAPLITLLLRYIGERNVNDPAPLLQRFDREREKLARIVRGTKIVTEVQGDARRRTVKNFTHTGADKTYFQVKDGTRQTVAQYYESTGRKLRYPRLPCVEILGSDARIPIEYCSVPDQLLPRPVDPEQTKEVLDFATLQPAARLREIRQSFQFLRFETDDTMISFGMNVNPNPFRVQARILPGPELLYAANRSVRPVQGVWKAAGKFIRPVEVKGVVLLAYENRDGLFSKDQAVHTAKGIKEALEKSGGRVTAPQPLFKAGNPQVNNFARDFTQAMVDYEKQYKVKANLILVVLPDPKGAFYNAVKHASECVTGITTQCLMASKCKDARSMYFDNVAMKINVKLGGTNLTPKAAEILAPAAFPTLYLGADVQHSKVMGDAGLGKPSITAVTGNIDLAACKYIAVSRAQETRVEMIKDFEEMVLEIINAFHRANPGKQLKRIVYYRDGVSEGQFAQVLELEVQSGLRAACRKAKIPSCKLTCIIVGKRHHIRLFPVEAKDADKSDNVPAGTVVEGIITSPVEFDFYLVPHAGLKGTSRPVHCNVLLDENNYTPDDLQTTTLCLSHVYARCTRSVSLPAPVYYAHLVCDRGQTRWAPGSGFDLDTSTKLSKEDAEQSLQEYIDNFKPLHPAQAQTMYFQ